MTRIETKIVIKRKHKGKEISMLVAVIVGSYLNNHVIYDDNYCCVLAFMYYYDNPKGMLPTWLINWVAKVSKEILHLKTSFIDLVIMLQYNCWLC